MEDTVSQLASDITQIKWALLAVSALLVIVATMLVFAFVMMLKAARNTEQRVERNLFHEQASTLVEEEDYEALKRLSIERLQEAPGDEFAHYFAATAFYRTGALVEAKKHYMRASKLSPLLRRECEDTVAELESTLLASKPRSVK